MTFLTNVFHQFSGASVGLSVPGIWVLNAVIVLVLLTCAYTDGTRGKIYNKVTFPAMLAGLLLNTLAGGWAGLGWSAFGLAFGMALQWVPYMLGLAKAGDVKLLMAVGALKGWALCGFGFLYGTIFWSLIAIPTLWRKGELAQVGQTIGGYVRVATATQQAPETPAPVTQKKYMPWGVGLALGFLLALLLEATLGKPFWFDSPW